MRGNSSSRIAESAMRELELPLICILLTEGEGFQKQTKIGYVICEQPLKAFYPPLLEIKMSVNVNDTKNVNYLDLNMYIKPNSISVTVQHLLHFKIIFL